MVLETLNLTENDIGTMHDMLKNTQCEVTFLKVNGEERQLLCTLREEYIKQFETPKTNETVTRKKSDDVISVFDIENNGWRSFRKDSVIRFEYLDTYSNIWLRLFGD
jgi:hypothetical protein